MKSLLSRYGRENEEVWIFLTINNFNFHLTAPTLYNLIKLDSYICFPCLLVFFVVLFRFTKHKRNSNGSRKDSEIFCWWVNLFVIFIMMEKQTRYVTIIMITNFSPYSLLNIFQHFFLQTSICLLLQIYVPFVALFFNYSCQFIINTMNLRSCRYFLLEEVDLWSPGLKLQCFLCSFI